MSQMQHSSETNRAKRGTATAVMGNYRAHMRIPDITTLRSFWAGCTSLPVGDGPGCGFPRPQLTHRGLQLQQALLHYEVVQLLLVIPGAAGLNPVLKLHPHPHVAHPLEVPFHWQAACRTRAEELRQKV